MENERILRRDNLLEDDEENTEYRDSLEQALWESMEDEEII